MDSEDQLLALGIDGFQLIPNSCRMQYHENVKLSSRDREEYTGHEKPFLQQRRNRERRNPRRLPNFRFAQISPLLWFFLVSGRVSSGQRYRMKRNTLSCVSCIATVSNNPYSLHSATILTHTIACSHIFFSETQHCYSRNDVRSQLVPFSAIPRS